MRIFITGASGFIGGHLASALAQQGHQIIASSRAPERGQQMQPDWQWIAGNLSTDLTAEQWLPRLSGVDLVINAAGIAQESGQNRFETVQTQGPIALFQASQRSGCQFLQISAMGADLPHQRSAFLCSKQRADDFIWAHGQDVVILYPSVVIGNGGASTALFCQLAALPVIPLIGQGEQRLNPIHVEDLTSIVLDVVNHWPQRKQRFQITGPEVYSMRELMLALRQWMQLPATCFIKIPMPLMKLAARLSERFHLSPLSSDTLSLLQASMTPAMDYPNLAVTPLSQRLRAPGGASIALQSIFKSFEPALIGSIALLWIFTGLTSAFLAPEMGRQLLAQAGIGGALGSLLLYGGAALDTVLGLALLKRPLRRAAYLAQLAVMALYLVIISLLLPEEWLNPLGSITKNLPLMMLTAMLWAQANGRAQITAESSAIKAHPS